MTRRQIHLVRHGRSAHAHAGWIDGDGFRAWRRAYEAAGIAASEQAPLRVQALARGVDVVVSSDAPRAQQSALLLAAGRPVRTSPLLRELELLAPALGRLRLPLPLWALAVGWRLARQRFSATPAEVPERERIAEAAEWLTRLSEEHGAVLAVAHASMRRTLARQLEAGGWKRIGARRTLRPWSVWSLARESSIASGA